MTLSVRRSLAAVALLAAACSPDAGRVLAPRLTPQGPARDAGTAGGVHISEIHYDNASTDAGEAVEVSFPIGTSLSGWKIVRFNGSNAAAAVTYTSPIATTGEDLGAIGATTCADGARAVVVVRYAQDGLQNGPNDGLALVNGSQVVELLSYEGPFTVSTGSTVAAGMTSTDIGVSQTGSSTLDPIGASLQRQPDGTWKRTQQNTFGACNDTPIAVGPYDHVAVGGAATVNANFTTTLTATLQDAANQTVTDPAATYTWQSSDETVAQVISTSGNTAVVKGLKVGGPVTITVDATSGGTTKTATAQLTVTQAPGGSISLSLGTSPLVIGYQTQVFVNSGSADKSGNPVFASNVTWSSSDPAIVSVDQRGLVTAAGNGTATITVTAGDGSTASIAVPTEVPLYNASARVGHNTEFGTPTDADASNDVIIAREQYTISYNPQRGGPNWVSWDLSASHLGTRNRCNCYSADTALVRLGYGQYMYNTLDYTNGGYDRGHMEPSADQTATDGENARTFFLTNFLPQQHGLNAGPWENLENALRDSVKAGREAYVIAGGVFTNGVGLGTLKNEGKIAIPDSTWKIVVLMPANTGLANVSSTTDVNVIAVNMPNVSSPPTGDWTAYKTTVAKIQKSTGYDFLAALPDAIECKVEASNCAPTARITGAGVDGGSEGQTLAFDATTSSDPDAGDVLSYEWRVNGQVVGIQPTLSRAFADNGTYEVRLTVSDDKGAASVATRSVTITNVAPTVNAFAGATILRGETYQASGTFSDPGADTFTGTVSYGDAPATSLALGAGTFALSHTYTTAGVRTVTVTVTDDDGGVGTRSAQVTVLSAQQGTQALAGVVSDLQAAGKLSAGEADALRATLDATVKSLLRENATPAENQLQAFMNQVDALLQAGRLSSADAGALTAYAKRIVASM
ncbi:DNA/RNA non-specific endonuclease [Gemmatirosa kalamazoonensis]|uniref:DNA/RNA non-specific endonuclease n=1 Tax=Gemmatirosa kalamazoonensis TaxID=861299 RepID=W0RNK7_9BACT|nr:DNA/RNA non-specific endonuclease [Gemmatirosa kalamazoonensis]AHG92082.1 DNA/RNA non-specific endonuclease [Gemmatirosa kalamazoonensis]